MRKSYILERFSNISMGWKTGEPIHLVHKNNKILKRGEADPNTYCKPI